MAILNGSGNPMYLRQRQSVICDIFPHKVRTSDEERIGSSRLSIADIYSLLDNVRDCFRKFLTLAIRQEPDDWSTIISLTRTNSVNLFKRVITILFYKHSHSIGFIKAVYAHDMLYRRSYIFIPTDWF